MKTVPATYDALHENFGRLIYSIIYRYARAEDSDEVYQHLWEVLLRRNWLSKVRKRIATETDSPEQAFVFFLRLLYTFVTNVIRDNYRARIASSRRALHGTVPLTEECLVEPSPEWQQVRDLDTKSLVHAVFSAVADDLSLTAVLSAVLATGSVAGASRHAKRSRTSISTSLGRVRARTQSLQPLYT